MSPRRKIVDPEKIEEPPQSKPDPRLCQCVGVQRRWDTDGLIETVEGVNYYRCAVCGKVYCA